MTQLIPQGFLYDKASSVEAKIIGFQQAGVDQLQVVLDFDRTLTVGQIKNREDSSSWQILKDHLSPEARARVHEPFGYYRAREVAGTMTTKDASDWWTNSLNLMAQDHLNMAAVEQDFMSKSTIRPGTKELFDYCKHHNIPTIILSAGVKDIIDIWARTYDIQPTIVIATSLLLDDQRRMIGWDKATFVHTLNKKEISHPELSKIRSERSHTILIGDSIHDFDMAEGKNTVFRVRIHDPRTDEVSDVEILHRETLKLFDAIIESGNLMPVTELIKRITS